VFKGWRPLPALRREIVQTSGKVNVSHSVTECQAVVVAFLLLYIIR